MRLFLANVKLYPFPDYQRFQKLMLKIRKARELIHIDLLGYGMVSANTASSEPQCYKNLTGHRMNVSKINPYNNNFQEIGTCFRQKLTFEHFNLA